MTKVVGEGCASQTVGALDTDVDAAARGTAAGGAGGTQIARSGAVSSEDDCRPRNAPISADPPSN